ncbi:glycosyltransferase family 4 protein [Flavobacteriaceae bacterium]|nr:glycosyltransferase family 4 protein [Flavobacteriaceae bacterium]
MKIIYFYQFFTTPKGSYGTRVYEFTKDWVELGHQVTVVTSVFYKSDIKANGLIDIQYINGVKLIIINIKTSNKNSFLKRVFGFITYSLISSYFAFTEKFDIVISSSPPISVGIPGLIAKLFRSKKLVFEVRDLWPEAPIALGFLNNRYLKKFFYYFEAYCYKNADLIIGLSPGIKQNIEKRFKNKKIISVTNSVNFDLFKNKLKNVPEYLIGKKYAIYTGNIGEVNNSELLFRAAVKLKKIGRKDIIIIMVGDGQIKDQLIFKSKKIETILFLDMVPKNELFGLVKNSFCSLIPLADISVLDTSSPNKLFESMAAKVPIIQTTNGWIKQMIGKLNCGFTVDPSDENILVEKLIYLADNNKVSKKMGLSGFLYAKDHFDKTKLSKTIIDTISKLKI